MQFDMDVASEPESDRFQCGQDKGSSVVNEWLAKKLDDMYDMYYGLQGKSSFAVNGYRRGETINIRLTTAAGIVRRCPVLITSGAQVSGIKGIGSSLADRIDEFLSGATGRAYYEDTERARAVQTLKDVYGVGPTIANELYNRGARTIDDLRNKDYGLSSAQQVRSAYHNIDSSLASCFMTIYVRGFREMNAAKFTRLSAMQVWVRRAR
jgi:DNA polymerase lambda